MMTSSQSSWETSCTVPEHANGNIPCTVLCFQCLWNATLSHLSFTVKMSFWAVACSTTLCWTKEQSYTKRGTTALQSDFLTSVYTPYMSAGLIIHIFNINKMVLIYLALTEPVGKSRSYLIVQILPQPTLIVFDRTGLLGWSLFHFVFLPMLKTQCRILPCV